MVYKESSNFIANYLMENKMATMQVNGSNVTGNYHSGGSSTRNDRGVMKSNGTEAGAELLSVTTTTPMTGIFGSTVVNDSKVDPALTGGAFAFNNNRPVAKKTTTSLAGVSNTVLRSGALVPSQIRTVNKIENVRTRREVTAIKAGKYNLITNTWESGYPVVAVDSLGADAAASPTASVPGTLVYSMGKNPVVKDYSSKTN